MESIDQMSQIPITLKKGWIRIRIKVKKSWMRIRVKIISGIRIRIEVMQIRNPVFCCTDSLIVLGKVSCFSPQYFSISWLRPRILVYSYSELLDPDLNIGVAL
jgi:hypothetical protein